MGHNSSKIRGDHDEILTMIGQLSGRRRPPPRRKPAGASASTSAASPHMSVDRTPLEQRRRALEDSRKLLRQVQARAKSEGGVQAFMQSLAGQLARIEARLEEQPAPSAGAPKPAASPESDDTALSGVILGDLLSDVLQLVSSNTLTGIFSVEGSGLEHTIYFEAGQIIHAEGPDLVGENAFFSAFALREGRYRFRETDELPEERTITGNTQFLILEALRQIDEDSSE